MTFGKRWVIHVFVNPAHALAIQESAGNFTGATLSVVDPETGLTESPDIPVKMAQLRYGNGSGPLSVFNVQKKLEFLNALHDCWPNLSKACAKVGISRWTLNNHISVDESLRQCIEEMRLKAVDNVHAVRFQVAATPSGSFDRMCVLNAHMPELYNPKIKVEVEHTVDIRGRSDKLGNVIDTEIVGTVHRLKAEKRRIAERAK